MNLNLKGKLLSLFLVLFLVVDSFAQKLPAGPQVLTFFSDADDTEQPYGLYIPQNYDEQKKYPLVIMLHGAGSNHRLSLRRVFGKSNAEGENDVEATKYFPEWKNVDYIVASPYARGTGGYQGIPEKDVYDVLADVKKRFSIDDDRIYLTGLSMGGGGTLWIGLTRPDIWAAIAPVCPAPPKGTIDLAGNALNIPVHLFQGGADPVVKPEGTREWVQKFKDLGVEVKYEEYPGVQHDSWVQAYKDEFIFDWFKNFKRNAFPDRVMFSSRHYKYDSAYWVKLDKITPGTLATIDVRYVALNKIEINTSALEGFSLKLKNHPKYDPKKPLDIKVDGKKVKGNGGEIISFTKSKGGWISGKVELEELAKKPGAEGPIFQAFSDRQIYVYGTQGNPTPEELKKRADLAIEAANWSVYRGDFLGRIMFFPRVIQDKDLRPSDLETSNLILFGTRETNSVIEKYADRLPVHLDSSKASTHGLFYVFPLNKHYVAVNSGLPWWMAAEEPGFRFVTKVHSILSRFEDFILFDVTGKTIAEGRFDQNWKLPETKTQSLKLNGVKINGY